MADVDLKTVCGDCGLPIQEQPEHERAPCPECGSTARTILADVGGELTFSGEATLALSRFIDHRSREAAEASATALTEIANWVEATDSLTVRHVADANISPGTVGVPLGPYSEDEVRDIVATINSDRKEDQQVRWDKRKTYFTWALSIFGLILTVGGLILAYVKFFRR